MSEKNPYKYNGDALVVENINDNRELNVYCEIHPYNKIPKNLNYFKALILSRKKILSI